MAKTMAALQAFPSFLLPPVWSRALIPFRFHFERLPRRLVPDWLHYNAVGNILIVYSYQGYFNHLQCKPHEHP